MASKNKTAVAYVVYEHFLPMSKYPFEIEIFIFLCECVRIGDYCESKR
jgi:hypothetical protein